MIIIIIKNKWKNSDPNGNRGNPKPCEARKPTDSLHACHLPKADGVANISGLDLPTAALFPAANQDRGISCVAEIRVISEIHTGTTLYSPGAVTTSHIPLRSVVSDHRAWPKPSSHEDIPQLQYNPTRSQYVGRLVSLQI